LARSARGLASAASHHTRADPAFDFLLHSPGRRDSLSPWLERHQRTRILRADSTTSLAWRC
jgi:hypothetical protein